MATILVIEDMNALREEIIDALSYEGFEAVGAENGAVGLQIAKARLPNLILCDVMMPELDGYGTLQALRQDVETATIPFIFLTAKVDKSDMRQGMELGADDYLTKPFTTTELLGAIDARLKKQAAIQEHYSSEIKRAEDKLAYQSQHDNLTNLPNRVLFHRAFKEAIQNARTNSKSLALFFVDIDRFNIINNALGHDIGDLLIVVVAERLRQALLPPNIVARLRGDEFAVVLTDIFGIDQVKQTAEKILDLLAKPCNLYGHEVFMTASLGITLYPQDHSQIDVLIKNADMALYFAKQQGRNNYKLYNSELNTQSSEYMALENSLRRAIDRGEFRLHYQPQVDLATKQIVGVEALVRWQHPELGLIMPAKFLPIAEESGLILRLGEWVFRRVCEQVAAWQTANFPFVRVAMNLSAQELKYPHFLENAHQVLRETGIPHSSLEMELPESSIMQLSKEAIATLSELRSMGIQIAIDDFGTGYASLSYLKHFPVDTLKIDLRFIQDLTRDKHDAAITLAIIDLAHNLALKVVAEGVETPEQRDFLVEHQCDRMQGVLFSPAVAAPEFEQILLGQAIA